LAREKKMIIFKVPYGKEKKIDILISIFFSLTQKNFYFFFPKTKTSIFFFPYR